MRVEVFQGAQSLRIRSRTGSTQEDDVHNTGHLRVPTEYSRKPWIHPQTSALDYH